MMEKVNHPAHYGGDTVYEHIKVAEAWGLNYALGNATKYIARAGKKSEDPIEDLKKARWYLDHEIERLEAERDGKALGSLVQFMDERDDAPAVMKAEKGRGNPDCCCSPSPSGYHCEKEKGHEKTDPYHQVTLVSGGVEKWVTPHLPWGDSK